MNKEELGKLYPITVVPYDTNWASIFENEKETVDSHCLIQLTGYGS